MYHLSPKLTLSFLATAALLATTNQARSAPIIQDHVNGVWTLDGAAIYGQTFTAEDSRIATIGFFIRPVANQLSDQLRYDLLEGVGTSGPLVTSITFTPSGPLPGYADADFSSVTFTVGQAYTILIQGYGLVDYNYLTEAGIDYVGGTTIQSGAILSSSDLRFRVMPFPEPILTNGVAAAFDFDEDGSNDFDYAYGAGRLGGPEEYYGVRTVLRSFGSGRCLHPAGSRIPFEAGELVSLDSPDVLQEGNANWITLGGYDVARPLPGAEWRYIDVTKNLPGIFWRNRWELLIGFRFTLEDGVHHGWFRFTRPDTHFITAFELAEYAWNPMPGEPIAAGLLPSLLRYEVTEDGLRLSWPAEAAGWILESTSPLAFEVHWEEVSGAGSTEVILPLEGVTRYFRLRRP